MANKLVTAAMGVSVGYENFSDEVDADEARRHTKDILKKMKAKKTGVFAGVAVYPKRFGCPEGGEPLGFIVADGSDNYEDKVKYIQGKLKQEEVYIVSSLTDKPMAIETIGVTAQCFLPEAELKDVAEVWQENASKLEKSGKPYVTMVIHKDDNNHLFFQAECNPFIYEDSEVWKATAKQCLAKTAAELGTNIETHFRKSDLNFSELDKSAKAARNLKKLQHKLGIKRKAGRKILPLNVINKNKAMSA